MNARLVALPLALAMTLPACQLEPTPHDQLLTVWVECPPRVPLSPRAQLELNLDEVPLVPGGQYPSGRGLHVRWVQPYVEASVHQRCRVVLYGDARLVVPGGRYELRVKLRDEGRVKFALIDHLDVFLDGHAPEEVTVRLTEGAPF